MEKLLAKYFIIIFSSLCLVNNAWSNDGVWQKLNTTGTPPSERSAPGLKNVGDYIYLYGGVKDDFRTRENHIYNDLYRLNLKTNHWENITPKGPLPSPRVFNALTYVKDKDLILLFGGNSFGKNFSNYKAYNDMWAYSLRSNTWTQIHPTTPPPSKRGSPMEWLVGNKWYIFGGISDWYQMLNDLWVYDIDANTWTQLIPNKQAGSPPGRYMEETRGSRLVWKDNLILQGGEILSVLRMSDYEINDIWKFDLKANKWTDITPPPKYNMVKAQNTSSQGIIGNYLYIQGGDVEENGIESCGAPFPQSLSNELWRYDLINHVWEKLSPAGVKLPTLKRTNGIVINDKLYVFYGFDFQCKHGNDVGQIWNKNIYVYTPNKENDKKENKKI